MASTVGLQTRSRVLRLYRDSLKNALNWVVQRELFYEEAEKIRARFEANKNLDDPLQIERALVRGEEELEAKLHPDPYIVPYRPGGSLYARNPPFPEGFRIHLDFGREKSHE